MEPLGEAIEDYLRKVVDRTRRGVSGDLVGAYLFGSGAVGGFVPARSDLDIAAIVGRELTSSERLGLAADLSHSALPCPARGLELVVYSTDDLVRPGSFQLNLNTGPEMPERVTVDPADEPAHWFVLDLAMGRESGRRLYGPAPQSVIPSIPETKVRGALVHSLEWYRANEPSSPSTVLNACRALRFLDEGRWSGKADAGLWALDRVTDPDLVRHALSLRSGEASEPLDEARVAALIGSVISTAEAR